MAKVFFTNSAALKRRARKIFKEEQQKIMGLIPSADIQHVGSTAIPGALTAGDLDIQVRVKEADFEVAKQTLSKIYHLNHPEMWDQGFALFHQKDHPTMPISIILTVIDSNYDEYSKVRDLLNSNQELLEKYNNLKRMHHGQNEEDYWKAKREFLGPNGASRILKEYS